MAPRVQEEEEEISRMEAGRVADPDPKDDVTKSSTLVTIVQKVHNFSFSYQTTITIRIVNIIMN